MKDKFCKDCIHYEVCDRYTAPNESYPEVDGCKCFKPKSRFIELLCAVGDTVYMPWEFDGAKGVAILTVMHIIFDTLHAYIKTDLISDCDEYLAAYNYGKFNFSDFGKTVFLTKEEAEKALAERNKK